MNHQLNHASRGHWLGIAAAAVALSLSFPGFGSEYGSGAADGDQQHIPIRVFDVFASREQAESAKARDEKFAKDMSRHHQGAIDMSLYYLADPRGTNPVVRRLADSIIRNQRHEIAVLGVVQEHLRPGAGAVASASGPYVLDRGIDGLEHVWKFVKSPPPGLVDTWLADVGSSEFDVQFARPMIEHHSMARRMALAYNGEAASRSVVLGSLNFEIIRDQSFEISLLEQIVSRYRGDANAVADDPKMMEIMHRSMAGMAGH